MAASAWDVLMCAQILMHVIAHGGCKNTPRESALEVDLRRKIPWCTDWGVELVLVLGLAFRPDALPTELSLPCKCFFFFFQESALSMHNASPPSGVEWTKKTAKNNTDYVGEHNTASAISSCSSLPVCYCPAAKHQSDSVWWDCAGATGFLLREAFRLRGY